MEGDVDRAFALLDIKTVAPGGVRLRRIPLDNSAGNKLFDDAVVGRWTATHATVMTHGGRAVLDGFLAACAAAGLERVRGEAAAFAEAVDRVEELMLATLARAKSPAAIDLLLDQPRRWHAQRNTGGGSPPHGRGSDVRSRALQRLIEPALVVAVGPPNIGKSSLLNALAGRSVAVVADQPGTTRDHVGTFIDLGGVVVRWVDTPGLEESKVQSSKFKGEIETDAEWAIQAEAQRLAREVAARADVLVVCADRGGMGASIEVPATRGVVVRVGLRTDLEAERSVEEAGIAIAVSVRNGTGLERLVEVVREAVVPRQWMEDGEPWAFWESDSQG